MVFLYLFFHQLGRKGNKRAGFFIRTRELGIFEAHKDKVKWLMVTISTSPAQPGRFIFIPLPVAWIFYGIL